MLIGLVILALTPLPCADAERTAVARLSPEACEHESVFVYEKIEGTFYVENVGSDPFRIASVKTTCACTTAIQTKGSIAPGERAEIRYDMSSAAPNRRSAGIFVQTNPPLAKPLLFKATGTWRPVIEADDDALTIEARFGEPFEESIALSPASGVGPIRVTGAKTRQTWAEITLTDPEDSALPALVVRSRGVVQPGTHKLGIALEFEREAPGKQNLTLDVHVRSDFTVTPSPLVVDITSGQPKPRVELTVRNERGKPFVPRSITAQRFRIGRPELPDTPASIQVIPLTIDLQDGPAPPRGRLLVDLGDGNGVLTVDVVFSIRPIRP